MHAEERKDLTRRVWPYHWHDKRTGYSGQLQYPFINTCWVLFTADDNGYPVCDRQSNSDFCNYSSLRRRLMNLNFIGNHNVSEPLFLNQDSPTSEK